MSGPTSTPRGEHAGRPGTHWDTALTSTGEQLIDDDTPAPRPNRATRRGAMRAGHRPHSKEQRMAEQNPECQSPQGCDHVVPCDPGCAVTSRRLAEKLAAASAGPAETIAQLREELEQAQAQLCSERARQEAYEDQTVGQFNRQATNLARRAGEAEDAVAQLRAELADMTRKRDEWQWRTEDAQRQTRCQRERAEQAEAAVAEARGLLTDLTDPDPCWYDHHGYCQAHGWMATEPTCPHARAKALAAPTPNGDPA